MSLMGKIPKWLTGRDDGGEAIARLLIAAREDPDFRRRLKIILQLPSHHRRSLVNDAVHQMALRGEPEDLRAAFSILATDEGAATALKVIDAD